MSAAQGAHAEGNGVNSRQVEVHQAYYKVKRARTALERKVAEAELAAILQRRHTADTKFGTIAFAAMKQDAARAEEMLEGEVVGLENVHATKQRLRRRSAIVVHLTITPCDTVASLPISAVLALTTRQFLPQLNLAAAAPLLYEFMFIL